MKRFVLTQSQIIDALDILDEVKSCQFVLESVLDILSNNRKKDILSKVTYLLFIYNEKMQENLPILEKILNGESEERERVYQTDNVG